jgi:hypothetical protein
LTRRRRSKLKKVIKFYLKNMGESDKQTIPFDKQKSPVDLQLTLEQVLETEEPVIGLSLLHTIEDILADKLPPGRLAGIISSTRAKDKEKFEELLSEYCKTYWSENPEKAKKIAMELYEKGRIIQPRLFDENFGPIDLEGKKYLPRNELTSWGQQMGLDKIMKGNGEGPSPYQKMLEVFNSPNTPTEQK